MKDGSYIEKTDRFAIISEGIILDKRISAKALGYFNYFVLRASIDGWKFYQGDILNHFSDGRDSVRTGIEELVKYGYLQRKRNRAKDGKFEGYSYRVINFMKPRENGASSQSGLSDSANAKKNSKNGSQAPSHKASSQSGLSASANPPLYIYNKGASKAPLNEALLSAEEILKRNSKDSKVRFRSLKSKKEYEYILGYETLKDLESGESRYLNLSFVLEDISKGNLEFLQ